MELLKAEHSGSLSPHKAPRGSLPCPSPPLSPPYHPEISSHYPHSPRPNPRRAMLGGTKAAIQAIGSTLLTACNLLISLARAHRRGVRGTEQVGRCAPALMRSSHFPVKRACLVRRPLSQAAPVSPRPRVEKCSHWHLLNSHYIYFYTLLAD